MISEGKLNAVNGESDPSWRLLSGRGVAKISARVTGKQGMDGCVVASNLNLLTSRPLREAYATREMCFPSYASIGVLSPRASQTPYLAVVSALLGCRWPVTAGVSRQSEKRKLIGRSTAWRRPFRSANRPVPRGRRHRKLRPAPSGSRARCLSKAW